MKSKKKGNIFANKASREMWADSEKFAKKMLKNGQAFNKKGSR